MCVIDGPSDGVYPRRMVIAPQRLASVIQFRVIRAALATTIVAVPVMGLAQTPAASSCDAECLTTTMSVFMTAMVSDRSESVPLADTSEVRENTRPVALDSTVWKDVKRVRSSVTFADPVSGNVVARAGVEMADEKPGYVSTRLRVGNDGRITDVEISADRSERVVASYVWELESGLSSVLPPQERMTRLELEALGRRYFNSLSTHVAVQADFDPQCDRFHSGQRITNNSGNTVENGPARTCAGSLEGNPPWGPATEHRFPVIDPERGIVFGLTLLHYLNGPTPRQMYVSEIFKVVNGRIVRIDNIGLMMADTTTMGFVH
jgi:hypothetical protein